jgi:hypothetical protein
LLAHETPVIAACAIRYTRNPVKRAAGEAIALRRYHFFRRRMRKAGLSIVPPVAIGLGMSTRNTVERAFELAASGEVQTFDDLRRKLQWEGYEAVEAHLAGTAIRKQLKELLSSRAPLAATIPPASA